jgi:hypothetical protein
MVRLGLAAARQNPQFPNEQKSVPGPRLVIKRGLQPQGILDGIAYPIPHEVADFLQAVIEGDGKPVSMAAYSVRSRQLDNLPMGILDLIDRKPGQGCRIIRRNLQAR